MAHAFSTRTLLHAAGAAFAFTAPLAHAQIEVIDPADGRIIVGSQLGVFDVVNTAEAGTSFTASLPGYSLTFLENGMAIPQAGPTYTLDSLSGGALIMVPTTAVGVAGDTLNLSLTLTPDGATAINRSLTYNLLDNRLLTGSPVAPINVGRHMASQSIGTISIDGGSVLQNEQTTIDVFAGGKGYVSGAAGQVYLSSSSDFTYDGTTSSHTFDIYGVAGAYSVQTALPSDSNTSLPGGSPAGFGSLLRSENAIGTQDMDLSGISLDVQGSALLDRTISQSSNVPNYRVMQAGPVTEIAVDESLFFYTSGGDDERTRLQLGTINQSAHGLTATSAGPTDFTSATSAGTVQVQGTLALDKSTLGGKQVSMDFGGAISTLEQGDDGLQPIGTALTGQTVQNSLSGKVTYNVLDDNELKNDKLNIYVFQGTYNSEYIGQTFVNSVTTTRYSTSTHTDIDFDQNFVATADIQTTAGQNITLTEGDMSGNGIFGEGLEGEDVQDSFTYSVKKKTIQHARISIQRQGDVYRVSNAGGLRTAAAVAISTSGADVWGIGFDSTLDQSVNAGSTTGTTIFLGASDSAEVKFFPGGTDEELAPGEIGRYYYGTATIQTFEYEPVFTNAAKTLGGKSYVGDLTTYSNRYIGLAAYAPDVDAGDKEAGDDLGVEGIAARSSTERATLAALIDSLTLDSAKTIGLNFIGDTGGVTDTVQVTGLDGVLHVLQISYTPTENPLEGAEVFWQDDSDNWVNAILGNSDVLSYTETTVTLNDGSDTVVNRSQFLESRKHIMSYQEYLESLGGSADPELGAFGIDPLAGTAWAVIDHNSDFRGESGLTPEPGTLAIFGIAGLLVGRRRRR